MDALLLSLTRWPRRLVRRGRADASLAWAVGDRGRRRSSHADRAVGRRDVGEGREPERRDRAERLKDVTIRRLTTHVAVDACGGRRGPPG
jgi:hypothetical protein